MIIKAIFLFYIKGLFLDQGFKGSDGSAPFRFCLYKEFPFWDDMKREMDFSEENWFWISEKSVLGQQINEYLLKVSTSLSTISSQ